MLPESAKLVCPRAMVERLDGSLVVAEQDSMRLQVGIHSSVCLSEEFRIELTNPDKQLPISLTVIC